MIQIDAVKFTGADIHTYEYHKEIFCPFEDLSYYFIFRTTPKWIIANCKKMQWDNMTYIKQSVTFLSAVKVNYDLLFSNLVWSKYI